MGKNRIIFGNLNNGLIRMKNFRVVPFKIEHGRDIFYRNKKEGIKNLCDGVDSENVMKVWMESGRAYTLLLDEVPIVCAGIVEMGWRRGEAWTLISSLFYTYRKTCFKVIRNSIDSLAKEMNLRRIQSVINESLAVKDTWMKHLGFERETQDCLRSFGPNGENFVMYSRVYP